MHIVILTDYFQTKIGYAKGKIAAALQKSGHTVSVVTSDRFFPFHRYQETVQPLLGPRTRSVGTQFEDSIAVTRLPTTFEAFTRVFYAGVAAQLRSLQPDVVLVFGISTFSAVRAAQLKSELGYKLIVADSHLPSELSLGFQAPKEILYAVFRSFFARSISRAADKVIALQRDTRSVIAETYGITKNSVVVENGTDTQLFCYSAQQRKRIRSELHIPAAARVLIYTGKVIPEKGVDILLTAWKKVARKNKKYFCIVVGSGAEDFMENCKRITAPYAEQVRFVPAQKPEELPAYYSAADVAVWPLQESLAMVEAASCELPFIANDDLAGTVRVSAENALLYKKGNTNDLATAVLTLLGDPPRSKRMGKRGRKLVEAQLSWDILAQQYLEGVL